MLNAIVYKIVDLGPSKGGKKRDTFLCQILKYLSKCRCCKQEIMKIEKQQWISGRYIS